MSNYYNGDYEITIHLQSSSILLDLVKKKRSFQDINMTYSTLTTELLAEDKSASALLSSYGNQKINKPIIQYLETDWEFLKRLASHFETEIIADVVLGEPVVKFVKKEHSTVREINVVKYSSGFDEKYYRLAEKTDCKRKDFFYYDIHSYDNLNVGDSVSFQLDTYQIVKKNVYTEKGEVRFLYRIANIGFIRSAFYENEHITGLSLRGVVMHAQDDHLWLQLEIDDFQDVETAFAYPWLPPSGNVLYMMPTIGTRVSLYFGSSSESSGRIINALRANIGNSETFSNPTQRGLVTELGAGITLEDMVYVRTPTGGESIEITGERILFRSAKKIELLSDKEITFSAKKIIIHGPETVGFIKGEYRPESVAECATKASGLQKKLNALEADEYLGTNQASINHYERMHESYKTANEALEYAETQQNISNVKGRIREESEKPYPKQVDELGAQLSSLQGELKNSATAGRPDIILDVKSSVMALTRQETNNILIFSESQLTKLVATKQDYNQYDMEVETVHQGYVEWEKIAANAAIGVGVVVIVVIVAAAALPATLPAGVFLGGAISGTSQVILLVRQDVLKGVASTPEHYALRALLGTATGMISAGVGYGLGSVIKNEVAKYIVTNILLEFVENAGVSALYQYIADGEVDAEEMLTDAVIGTIISMTINAVIGGVMNHIQTRHAQRLVEGVDDGFEETYKLKYETSNGLELVTTQGKTTTVLGTYNSDTGAILDELGNIKSTDLGSRDGGFNLLNTPDEFYVTPEQFWSEYNKPWLDNVISRNDIIKIATEPIYGNLYRINKVTGLDDLTGFGREFYYLVEHGYVYDPIIKSMSR